MLTFIRDKIFFKKMRKKFYAKWKEIENSKNNRFPLTEEAVAKQKEYREMYIYFGGDERKLRRY